MNLGYLYSDGTKWFKFDKNEFMAQQNEVILSKVTDALTMGAFDFIKANKL